MTTGEKGGGATPSPWTPRDADERDAVVEWRPVVGFEGFYEVNANGELRSLSKVVPSSRRKTGAVFPRRVAGRTMRHHIGTVGYPIVTLARDGQKFGRHVHRLVLEAFVGPCPPGMEARHLNGVRSDCRLENLAWGTKIENADDKRRHGTILCGLDNPIAKLTPVQVEEIRAAKKGTVTALCRTIGISRSRAILIRSGKAWLTTQEAA